MSRKGTVLIHAGLKKCGSSSIHAFLGANRKILKKANICYPGPGRPGTRIANEIRHRKGTRGRLNALAKLAEFRATHPEAMTVISSEMFEPAEECEVELIRQHLATDSADIIVLFVIRDLVELVPSIYAQKVKTGSNILPFDEFFEVVLSDKRVDYFDTVSKWANVFGWEHIIVRVLDPAQLVNSDLLDDILSVLGVDPSDAKGWPLERPGVSNSSSGWQVLEAMRALRSGGHGLPDTHPLTGMIQVERKMRRLGAKSIAIGQRFGWNSDRGRYLTAVQAERCLDLYTATVLALNAKLPAKLALPRDLAARGFQEREFAPDVSHIPRERLEMFYNALCGGFVEKNSTSA